MTMQAHRFSDGSYVLHKAKLNDSVSKLTFSVWFTPEGDVKDCEGFDASGRSRSVSDKVRKALQSYSGLAFNLAKRSV